MSFDDFTSDFLAARGLRLVTRYNQDEVVQGVTIAPALVTTTAIESFLQPTSDSTDSIFDLGAGSQRSARGAGRA